MRELMARLVGFSSIYHLIALIFTLPIIAYVSMLRELQINVWGYDIRSFSDFSFGLYGVAIFSFFFARVLAVTLQVLFFFVRMLVFMRREERFTDRWDLSDPASRDRYSKIISKILVRVAEQSLSSFSHYSLVFVIFIVSFSYFYAVWSAFVSFLWGGGLAALCLSLLQYVHELFHTRSRRISDLWNGEFDLDRDARIELWREVASTAPLRNKRASIFSFLEFNFHFLGRSIGGVSRVKGYFPILLAVPLGMFAFEVGESRADLLKNGKRVEFRLQSGSVCGPVLLLNSKGYVVGDDSDMVGWTFVPIEKVELATTLGSQGCDSTDTALSR
jgi:hypothetical protein